MTSSLLNRVGTAERQPSPRHYRTCPPTFFDIAYAVSPWIAPGRLVHRQRALVQWSALVAGYRSAGHRVELLEPVEGLPDQVLAGYGFRATPEAHAELARVTGRQVPSLGLTNSSCYHLDGASNVLDDQTDHLAYCPSGFSPAGQALPASRFPHRPAGHRRRRRRGPAGPQLRQRRRGQVGARRGHPPAGGSVGCCTQEIRPPQSRTPEGTLR